MCVLAYGLLWLRLWLRLRLQQGLEDCDEARIAVPFPVSVPVKVKCDLDVRRRRARYVLLDVFHRHVGVLDEAVKRTLVILQAVLQGAHGFKVLHDGVQEAVRGGIGDAIDFSIDHMFVSTRRRPLLRLVWCE